MKRLNSNAEAVRLGKIGTNPSWGAAFDLGKRGRLTIARMDRSLIRETVSRALASTT